MSHETASTCALCGCVRTPAEVEYLPTAQCAECCEMTEELAYFARSGVFHGEAPRELGWPVDWDEPVTRIPLHQPSPLARIRVRHSEPWGVLSIIVAAFALLVWGLA